MDSISRKQIPPKDQDKSRSLGVKQTHMQQCICEHTTRPNKSFKSFLSQIIWFHDELCIEKDEVDIVFYMPTNISPGYIEAHLNHTYAHEVLCDEGVMLQGLMLMYKYYCLAITRKLL